MKMKRKIDKTSTFFGVIFIIIFLVEVYSIFLVIGTLNLLPGLGDFALLFGSGYVIYKTIIKKQPLSKEEKFCSIFLVGLFLFSFFVGFYMGISNLFSEEKFLGVSRRWNIDEKKENIQQLWLIDNKTLKIEGRSYYVYPIFLRENQTVRFVIKTITNTNGFFNTLMLNSAEYNKLISSATNVYILYYLQSYTSGVRNADLWITVDKDDTYYFIISTLPIIRGQVGYDFPIDVVLTVYTLQ